MIFGNNSKYCEYDLVRGSDAKVALSVEGYEGTAVELVKSFVRATVTAGGRSVNIPARQVQPSSDDTGVFPLDDTSIAITFNTTDLGYGRLEVEAEFNIPDRDFPDDKKRTILRGYPGYRIV